MQPGGHFAAFSAFLGIREGNAALMSNSRVHLWPLLSRRSTFTHSLASIGGGHTSAAYRLVQFGLTWHQKYPQYIHIQPHVVWLPSLLPDQRFDHAMIPFVISTMWILIFSKESHSLAVARAKMLSTRWDLAKMHHCSRSPQESDAPNYKHSTNSLSLKRLDSQWWGAVQSTHREYKDSRPT